MELVNGRCPVSDSCGRIDTQPLGIHRNQLENAINITDSIYSTPLLLSLVHTCRQWTQAHAKIVATKVLVNLWHTASRIETVTMLLLKLHCLLLMCSFTLYFCVACVDQECYSTALKNTDGKKQKVILRILKRIVSVLVKLPLDINGST